MDSIAHVRIISDSELTREGIKRIISEEGIAASCAHSDDEQELTDLPGYVFLVDADQEKAGLETCLRLRARLTHSKIVLMSTDFSIQTIRRGFDSGIDGFITRRTGYSALICKLALIVTGDKILPVGHLEALLSCASTSAAGSPQWPTTTANLSEREIGILECLVNGDANKMISRRLNIAEPTVKVHVKSILRKLQLSNRTQAAIWAINQRIGPASAGVVAKDGAPGRKAMPFDMVS